MKKKIIKKLNELEKIFPELNLKYKVKFNLKSSKIVGMCKYRSNNKHTLYFNHKVAKKVKYKMYKEVIIHELGHLITRYIYGYGVQSHGKEWRQVMYALGSKKPRAKIDFSKHSESFKTEFKMKCKCKKHYFTTNKRTRLRNGIIYRCDDCGKKIKEK